MSYIKTTSLIHANIYISVIWLRISSGKFLRTLWDFNASMWLIIVIVISLKFTEIIPTLFLLLFMLRWLHVYDSRKKQCLEMWMKFQYGRGRFLADGSGIFCSLWMGRENWPVGQQVSWPVGKPIHQAQPVGRNPRSVGRWSTPYNWRVGCNGTHHEMSCCIQNVWHIKCSPDHDFQTLVQIGFLYTTTKSFTRTLL